MHERYGLLTPRMVQACGILIEAGIRRDKAEQLALRDRHTLESVLQAVQNAAVKVLAGELHPHRRTGYIVASLEKARREGHVVRPSRIYQRAKQEQRRLAS